MSLISDISYAAYLDFCVVFLFLLLGNSASASAIIFFLTFYTFDIYTIRLNYESPD